MLGKIPDRVDVRGSDDQIKAKQLEASPEENGFLHSRNEVIFKQCNECLLPGTRLGDMKGQTIRAGYSKRGCDDGDPADGRKDLDDMTPCGNAYQGWYYTTRLVPRADSNLAERLGNRWILICWLQQEGDSAGAYTFYEAWVMHGDNAEGRIYDEEALRDLRNAWRDEAEGGDARRRRGHGAL